MDGKIQFSITTSRRCIERIRQVELVKPKFKDVQEQLTRWHPRNGRLYMYGRHCTENTDAAKAQYLRTGDNLVRNFYDAKLQEWWCSQKNSILNGVAVWVKEGEFQRLQHEIKKLAKVRNELHGQDKTGKGSRGRKLAKRISRLKNRRWELGYRAVKGVGWVRSSLLARES